MDIFKAIQLAEGVIESDNADDYKEAWQLLVDTGVIYDLGDEYIKNAKYLIKEGLIKEKAY